jgi:hypothetical protein
MACLNLSGTLLFQCCCRMARKLPASSWFKAFAKSSPAVTPAGSEFVVDGDPEAAPTPRTVQVAEGPRPTGDYRPADAPAHSEKSCSEKSYSENPADRVVAAPELAQRRLQFKPVGNRQPTAPNPAKRHLQSYASRSGAALGRGWQAVQTRTLSAAADQSERLKVAVARRRWTILSLGILAFATGTATASVLWLSRVPPAPECNKMSPLAAEGERLYCAQVSAHSGQPEALIKAINTVKGWDKDHPLYAQAQGYLGQWSEALLISARERLGQNDLDGAVKMAQQIPPISPLYKDAQEAIVYWQSERNRGQKIYDKFLMALKQQSWDEGSSLIAKLTLIEDPTWQTRLAEIRKLLDFEKAAGFHLKQAQEFARNNPPNLLGQAISLTNPINRKTFVWQKAESEIKTWRDQVLTLAASSLLKKDVATASGLVKSLPMSVEITPVQQDLLRLVTASEVDAQTDHRAPLMHQLWQILNASSAMQQIATDSPYRKPADALVPRLDMQVQDAMQVEVARAFAHFGQLSSLQTAIDQAQQVQSKRPRRIEAQTLVAQWRQDVERIEDRPLIKQAQLLAKAGSPDQLKAAVDIASRIPKSRALYSTAQSQIGQWVGQIQTLEDQPILSQARGVARNGQLGQAVQIANKIRPGRALYGEAQGEVGNWLGQLQAIEDRAALDRAAALAAQGSLSRAIDTASQVRSGNGLGQEAQESISRWSRQRDEVRRTQEPAPAPAAPLLPPTYAEPTPPVAEPPRRYEPAPEPPRRNELAPEPVAAPTPAAGAPSPAPDAAPEPPPP